MLTPAMIPVTAGKKTANTSQNGTTSKPPGGAGTASAVPVPRKNDTSDSTIAAMITYCALMAVRAEISAKPVTRTVVTSASGRIGISGATALTLSANPSVYSATDNAWARYSGMPIAPPISEPSDRLTM